MRNNDIFILDENTNLAAILSNDADNACPFYDAPHLDQENAVTSFDFTVPVSHADSVHVKEENHVMIKEDGVFKLFVIKRIEDEHGDGIYKRAYCDSSALELRDDIVEDLTVDGSANIILKELLRKTRWELGKVGSFGKNAHMRFYYVDVIDGIQQMIKEFDAVIEFRVVFSDGKVVGRYVDIKERNHAFSGRRFEFSKDMKSIKRTIESTDLKTAVIPRGKGEDTSDDFTPRLSIKDVVWKKSSGDPVDKPKGQTFIGDPDALDRYGRLDEDLTKRHRYYIFDDGNIEDAKELIQAAWDDLQKYVTPRITYEVNVVDLAALLNISHEGIKKGDVVLIIDKDLNLRVTARIIEIEKYVGEPERTKVTLGNFIPSFVDDSMRLDYIEDQLNNNAGKWNDKLGSGSPIPTDWLEGNIPTSILEGAIDTLQNEVRSNNGYVYITDYDGITVLDKAEDANPTKAIQLKGGMLAIANSKKSDGSWNFRTFGDGDGFTADLLTTGKVMAELIQIGGGSTYEEGYDPSEKETPSGAEIKAAAAEAAAKAYAETAAKVAEDAANAVAKAEAKLAEETANAYADGRVTDEERARIKEAADKLAEAKAHAEAKATAAEQASLLYTEGYAEKKHIESKTEPNDQTALWVDTSKEPNIIKRYDKDDKKWVKLTPTNAGEVGAETPEGAQAKAKAAADNAEAAARAYAEAQDELERVKAEAYADGKVTDEEKARIKEAKENLEAAKKHAEDKADEAARIAKDYADETSLDAKEAAEAVAKAQIELSEESLKAYADGAVSVEEAKRIEEASKNLAKAKEEAQELAKKAEEAARSYAKTAADDAQAAAEAVARAQSELAEVQAKAYADGKVTDEEKARIAEAKKNLEDAKADAKTKAEAAEEAAKIYTDELEIGGANLLDNTDFSKDDNIDDWVNWLSSIKEVSSKQVDNYDFLYISVNSEIEVGDHPRVRTPYKYHFYKGHTYTVSWLGFASDYISTEGYGGIYIGGLVNERFNPKKERIGTVRYNNLNKALYRYTHTFQFSGENDDECSIYMGGEVVTAKSSYILISQLKLEKGSKATSWAPSDKDVEERTETVAKARAEKAADDAEAAAKAYAKAQDELERTKSEAYADGKVTQEEQARIDAAKKNLDEAKKHAETKATAAEKAAKDYAESAAKDAEDAANAVTEARAKLVEEQAKAYADGKVTTEEKARIKEAEDNLAAAKAEAAAKSAAAEAAANLYTDEMEVGGANLLDNTDFTKQKNIDRLGSVNVDRIWRRDYDDFNQVFIQVRSKEDLDANVAPRVTLLGSKFRIDEGETYTLSWVATANARLADFNYTYILRNGSGFSVSNNIKRKPIGTATVGSYTHTVYHYQTTFTANWSHGEAYPMFGSRLPETISGTTWFRIGSIKLEKGSKATDWAPSYNDIYADSLEKADNAEEAAKAVAEAAAKLTEERSKAYADGVLTDEERARIKQAEENLAAAIKHADDMEVGGTNLARNGDFENGESFWVHGGGASGGQWRLLTSANHPSLTRMGRITHDSLSSDMLWRQDNIKVEKGETYTLTAWGYLYGGNKAGNPFSIQIGNGSAGYTHKNSPTTKTKWLKVSLTFEAPDSEINVYAGFKHTQTSGKVDGAFTGIKLEKGVKSTDWSPHPRDVAAAVNGKAEITIDRNGFRSTDSKGNTRIFLGIRNLAGKGQSDPATLLFYGGSGSTSAGIGMNVDDTFVIGSDSNKIATEIRSGKNTIYYADQHRFVTKKQNSSVDGDYYWVMRQRNAATGNSNPIFEPSTSGWGYIGSSPNRIWRIYTNHLHYLEQHKLSTRWSKTDIDIFEPEEASRIFDQIGMKTYRYLITGGVSDHVSIGVIAEESPPEILDPEGMSLNQDNFIGVIAGTVKHHQRITMDHRARIEDLEETVSKQSETIAKQNDQIDALIKRMEALESKLNE